MKMTPQLTYAKDKAFTFPDSGAAVSQVKLSVVIVNYNTATLTAQCIEAVRSDRPVMDLEIIVVDNGSTDESTTMLPAMFRNVRFIWNDRNSGFASGNNQGIRKSSGQYILLLNSDTIVMEGSLKGMVDFLDAHKEVGAVGPRLVSANGFEQVSFGHFHSLATVILEVLPFQRAVRLLTQGRGAGMLASSIESPKSVDYVSGACMMVRRECVEEIGLLDERFFMYSEEMDWCFRIHANGWKVFTLPMYQIVHIGGASSKTKSAWRLEQLVESRNLFLEKHHSRLYFVLTRSTAVAIAAFSWSMLAFFNLFLSSRFVKVANKKAYFEQRLRLERGKHQC